MAGSKFDPQLSFQRPDNVALRVPAAELFGLLKRSIDLPTQWAALVRRTIGDHKFVASGGEVESGDADDVMFVRVTPFEVAFEEEGVISRDRYQCRCEIRLQIGVVPERSELISFQDRVLGSHRVIQASGVARYLQPAVRAALAKVAAERDASELTDASAAGAISDALSDAVGPPCFSAGLALSGRPTAAFHSQTLRQVQRSENEAARRQAVHAASRELQLAVEKAQSDHLEHLTSMLTRLRELAAASPDVELPELIRTFSDSERGELYEALFSTEPITTQTQWIVVAAGDELLFFGAGHADEPCRRLQITGDAGPVRSIQTATGADGNTLLLLGAATGVYRWPIERAEPDATFLVGSAPSVRGGFNAVTVVGDRVLASHSELGLYEWAADRPRAGEPRFASMTRSAKAVRGVAFLSGELYCAVDDRVVCWPADDRGDKPARICRGSLTSITAVCPRPEGLYAGNGNGDVLHWPKQRESDPERLHTGLSRAAESVWVLATHGVRRVVYTDTSLHVHARVLGDAFTCRYEAGGQTLRRVEVAPDLLVATNDLRDRLIVWSPGEPTSPKEIVNVSRLCGHSVQDVCLVPKG